MGNKNTEIEINKESIFIKQLLLYLFIIIFHIFICAVYFFYKRTFVSISASRILGIIAVISVTACFSIFSKYLFNKWWFVNFVSHSQQEKDLS